MTTPPSPSRRDFLASSTRLLGSGWVALHWPALVSLSACARDAARSGAAFTTLSAAEGAALRAVAARIVPSDDGTPGAEEAGAAWFADAALGTRFSADLDVVRGGLHDLDGRARAAHGRTFAALGAGEQDELLRQLEETAFFDVTRTLVVLGVFTAPEYGGNRGGVGWALLGVDHHAAYRPPFGWYDAQHTAGNGP